MPLKPLILSYFLPGFTDDKYNSKWWGKGFTEWNSIYNVKKLFENQSLPFVPLDGPYDLADPTILSDTFQLAHSYGIDGFVVYDYWSRGERPLGKVSDILLEANITFPYYLCWANHDWTRSWKNRSGALDVLFKQEYESQFANSARIAYLVRHFSSNNYIKHNDRPILQIYKPLDFPSFDLFKEELTSSCHRSGLKSPLFIANLSSIQSSHKICSFFDYIVPSVPTLPLFGGSKTSSLFDPRHYHPLAKRFLYLISDTLPFKHRIYNYRDMYVTLYQQLSYLIRAHPSQVISSVFSSFDNTPRYNKRAIIVDKADPSFFLSSLYQINKINPESPFILINAWNEWGEGMAIEPSNLYGDLFLSSIKTFSLLFS